MNIGINGKERENKRTRLIGKMVALLLLSMVIILLGTHVADKIINPKVLLGGQTVAVDYIEEGIVFTKSTYLADFSRVGDGDSCILQIGDVPILAESDLENALNLYDSEIVEVKVIRNGKIFSESMLINEYTFPVERAHTNASASGKICMYIPEISYALAFAHPITFGEVNGVIYDAKAVEIDMNERSINVERTDEVIGIMKSNDVYGAIIKYDKEKIENKSLEYIEIAQKKEVELGKAYLYTDVGEGLNYYEIEIISLNDDNRAKADDYEGVYRGLAFGDSEIDKERFLFHIVDERLSLTEGVALKGMSGSPIIQNGKLIGFNGYRTKYYSIAIYAETAYWDTIKKYWEEVIK